jgi:hypothetical protein
MKICKHCGKEGFVDKLGRCYSICKKCKNNNLKGRLAWNSGKKGVYSKETIEKIRTSLQGRKLSEEHKKNIKKGVNKPETLRVITLKSRAFAKSVKGKKLTERYSKVKADRISRISRISRLKQLEKSGIKSGMSIGTNEKEILDAIEVENSISLTRQYRVNGYFIDGYDEDNNVVYEVLEKFHRHRNPSIKDKIRKERIIASLNCNFIEIRDGW